MRKNIFEIIKAKKSILQELSRIQDLIRKKGGVYENHDVFAALTRGTPKSIIEYIDSKLFKKWKQRGTCIDCEDLFQTLGIDYFPEMEDDITDEYLLNFCECIANLIALLQNNVIQGDTLTDIVSATEENIKNILSWYNYEIKVFPKEEKVLVVSKNPLTASVVENLESPDLAYLIIEYNHHLLKGNIERKKSILLALGAELEPKRAEIKALNKDLEDQIFFMLNNLNLRHNNKEKGDKHYKEKVAKMKKTTLENWYDELYQLMLTAYTLLNNKERMKKIATLKQEINS